MNAPVKATFLRAAILPAATIIILLALKALATPLYATSVGRFPAMMTEVMSSRSLLYFWSPAGYYEELFSAKSKSRQQTLFGSTTFVKDAFRLRRLRPNVADVTDWKATDTPVNRFGYIGPDWSFVKPPDTRRVAVLGDSVPEGYGVNMSQGFVDLLADRLNELPASFHASERFQFLNFSVSGYELTQMMDVAERDAPPFHPDVYLVFLTELSVHRGWDSHLIYLIRSGVDLRYGFLRDVVRRANARPTDSEAVLSAKLAPYRLEVVRRSLLAMKRNAEQHGAQFIVVLTPTAEDADIVARRFAGIPELLSGMNISFIDLSNVFMPMLGRDSVRRSETDVHPNPAGHRMICDALYARLRENQKLWTQLTGTASAGDKNAPSFQ